jgi:hypothetical protein
MIAMIKEMLEPKDEVLAGRLQGVIDIERVSDPKKRALEARAKDFLQSTFVSGEISQAGWSHKFAPQLIRRRKQDCFWRRGRRVSANLMGCLFHLHL